MPLTDTAIRKAKRLNEASGEPLGADGSGARAMGSGRRAAAGAPCAAPKTGGRRAVWNGAPHRGRTAPAGI